MILSLGVRKNLYLLLVSTLALGVPHEAVRRTGQSYRAQQVAGNSRAFAESCRHEIDYQKVLVEAGDFDRVVTEFLQVVASG